jgi:4-hydroxy-3-polyprenylbenzoate decarboxylase
MRTGDEGGEGQREGGGEEVRRFVVAISGASGAIYGLRLIEVLKDRDVEVHLIVSPWGWATIEEETSYTADAVKGLADYYYEDDDLSACLASGSFKTEAMIVSPCSMKTLASVACGFADNLISRAADVALKESRKLIMVVRESPLNAIHLQNMLTLSRLGVILLPPVPAFYIKPTSIGQLVDHTVGKILDQVDISHDLYKRWT